LQKIQRFCQELETPPLRRNHGGVTDLIRHGWNPSKNIFLFFFGVGGLPEGVLLLSGMSCKGIEECYILLCEWPKGTSKRNTTQWSFHSYAITYQGDLNRTGVPLNTGVLTFPSREEKRDSGPATTVPQRSAGGLCSLSVPAMGRVYAGRAGHPRKNLGVRSAVYARGSGAFLSGRGKRRSPTASKA